MASTAPAKQLGINVDTYIVFAPGYKRKEGAILPAPEYVESVRTIPRSLRGPEKRYLEALRQNVEARIRYNEAALHVPLRQQHLQSAVVPESRLQGHLNMLRLRKRLEQLSVLRKYLTSLEERDAAHANFLKFERDQKLEPFPITNFGPESESQYLDQEGPVKITLKRLEMAVVAAKSKADHERTLLQRLESSVELSDSLSHKGDRCSALTASKNELVSWIERNLSVGASSEYSGETSTTQPGQFQSSVPHLKTQIMDKYQNYVTARRRLILLASIIQGSARTQQANGAPKSSLHKDLQTSSLCMTRPSPIPFVHDQIQLAAQNARFSRQYTAYAKKLSRNEREKTSWDLERLVDESHVLSSYPIMARADRLKQRMTSNVLAMGESSGNMEEVQIRNRLDAWKFAARSSRDANDKSLNQDIESGRLALQEGEDWLERLREIVGYGDATHPRSATETVGVDSAGLQYKKQSQAAGAVAGQATRQVQSRTVPRNPWASFQGNVGVPNDEATNG